MVLPRYFEVVAPEGYFALDVIQFMFRKFDQPFDCRSGASRFGSCRDNPFDHRIAAALNVICHELDPHNNLVFVSFLKSHKKNISEVVFGNFLKQMAYYSLPPVGGFPMKQFLYFCTTAGSMAARLHWMGRKFSGHYAVKVIEDTVLAYSEGNADWEALQEFAGNYVESRRRGTSDSEQESVIDIGLNGFTANQEPDDFSQNQSQGDSPANQGQDYFPASQDCSATEDPVHGDASADPVQGEAAAGPIQGDANEDPVQVAAILDPGQCETPTNQNHDDATEDPVQGDATVDPVQGDETAVPEHVAAILDPGQCETPTNQDHDDATENVIEDLVHGDATADPVQGDETAVPEHVAAILDPGQCEAPTNQGHDDATEDPVQGGFTVHPKHPVTAFPRQLCVTAYSINRIIIEFDHWKYGATFWIKQGVILNSYRKHGVVPFSWKCGNIFFPIKYGAIFYPGQLGVFMYSMQNSFTRFAAQNIVTANYKMLSYFRNCRRLAQYTSGRVN